MAEPFEIYEALLWEPVAGYFLLDLHLQRLARSAKHFGFALDAGRVRAELLAFAATLPARPRKVRLELSADGSSFLEHVDVKPSTPVRVALALDPVDSADEFLRHKTSRRGVYERALAAQPGRRRRAAVERAARADRELRVESRARDRRPAAHAECVVRAPAPARFGVTCSNGGRSRRPCCPSSRSGELRAGS